MSTAITTPRDIATESAREGKEQLERIRLHEIKDDWGEQWVAQFVIARKARLDQLDEIFAPALSAALTALNELRALKHLATDPQHEAIAIGKAAIAAYHTKKQARIEEENRRQLEALERQHAEQIESEALQAEQNGASAAEVQAIIERPNFYDGYAPQAQQKIKGISKIISWAVEVTDKRAFIQAALSNPAMFGFVEVNANKLSAHARLVKGQFEFPGLKITKKTDVRASGKSLFEKGV